jgi:hypothetical protein
MASGPLFATMLNQGPGIFLKTRSLISRVAPIFTEVHSNGAPRRSHQESGEFSLPPSAQTTLISMNLSQRPASLPVLTSQSALRFSTTASR